MNRTDRLLAIVLELQGKGRQRAEDLAATFETSKRTIYRDMQALGQAGVPLISVPGHGYSLVKGYFLPPLSFTTEEATMLLLGSDYMAHNFDAQYRTAAQSAGRKIAGVLPEKLRDEVQYLQSNIRFIVMDGLERSAEPEMLQQLRRAIIERTTVRFRYHTRHAEDGRGTQSTRDVDPYSLLHVSRAWHVLAYCHMRQGIRYFRLDRIEDLELLARTFTRRTDFQIGDYQGKERNVIVRALFDKEVARWAHESRSFFVVMEEETPKGLMVTLRVRQVSEVLQWLLSWGRHVHILEPESLRKLLVEEAEGILHNHQNIE